MQTPDNQKIKDGIKSTFDEVAHNYDNNKQFILSAKKMLDLIDIKNPKATILDLSSGTGNIAIEVAKKYSKATIYGVDLSDEMLQIAREKTAKENLDNIIYSVQDVENLQFENEKFDLITCGYGLFFYPDIDNVFCDICSRLNSDGLFTFSSFNENAFQPYSKIFLTMLEEHYDIKPPNSIEKRLLSSENEIRELTSQVKDIDVKIHPIEIRFAMSIDEWWQLLNSTGYKGLLSQLGGNYKEFELTYKKYLHSLSNDGSIEFNADSWITVVTV